MYEAQARWRECLSSAFRTALACTIVCCTTLYGPAFLQRQIPFPAFSYVTAILIVSTDATLGDTLRGCWLALYATAQIAGPAILCLWLIGPARLSSLTTALAVALCAFVVVLPESTHLVAKRIALGQSVILYVIAFIDGADTEAVMHPVHVAASTAVGALASLLALLLPYPRLAYYEVKQKRKLLAENAAERLKLFVQAFCAEEGISALALISQAKSCGTGTKFLQSIKTHQESMQWERLAVKIIQPWQKNTGGGRLQDTEMLFRGMEMALTNISSYPVKMLDGELKDDLLRLFIKQAKCFLPIDPVSTVPESSSAEDHHIIKSLQKLRTIPITHQDLPSFFFLFCMKSIHDKSLTKPSVTKPDNACKINVFCFKGIWSSSRLMPAFKCSLSLGLAVLFGLLYSKENGYWSALPVAISLASAREPTFKIANIKAQGTALGTVYGVLGCFLFKKFLPIRILSLLPWFILTDFLRRSRIYGQAGGISAVIGAVLILGRKNFGSPSEFAIARITETFIGLSCSIIVELILQPTRASVLSKILLSKSLGTLHTCVNSVSLGIGSKLSDLEQSQKRLQIQISELEKLIEEADVEPNFWFLAFHSACYGRLLQSLTKMVDLLHFIAQIVGYISLQQESQEGSWEEVVNKLNDNIKLFKEMVGSSIKCSEQVTSIKSLTLLETELEKKNVSCDDDDDLELGKSQDPKIVLVSSLHHENGMEEIIDSYLQHSEELLDKIHGDDENELKCQVALNLAALGFCMSSLVKETREIEKEIKELVQWENPLSHIDLNEISSKIHALHKL
ncbi:uncharacterized protein LOC132163062 [Corylus avellana]|uniref:uncharacterized protein LOC132163062 n=1 Tax=Corylus avellana TaxID=13451 RepID=UPI001E1F4972|nr:uncharacterized protein LOC132163062 [Corylus avellana]